MLSITPIEAADMSMVALISIVAFSMLAAGVYCLIIKVFGGKDEEGNN